MVAIWLHFPKQGTTLAHCKHTRTEIRLKRLRCASNEHRKHSCQIHVTTYPSCTRWGNHLPGKDEPRPTHQNNPQFCDSTRGTPHTCSSLYLLRTAAYLQACRGLRLNLDVSSLGENPEWTCVSFWPFNPPLTGTGERTCLKEPQTESWSFWLLVSLRHPHSYSDTTRVCRISFGGSTPTGI